MLNYETKDPLILSCVLSCVSALFIYINNCPEKLSTVLNKIFNAAQFTIEGEVLTVEFDIFRPSAAVSWDSLVESCVVVIVEVPPLSGQPPISHDKPIR